MTPFVCFASSFFVVKTFEYAKKNKDEFVKMLLILLLILAIIGSIYVSVNYYKSSKYQAKNTGPSANYQWQNAMSWVRNNGGIMVIGLNILEKEQQSPTEDIFKDHLETTLLEDIF